MLTIFCNSVLGMVGLSLSTKMVGFTIRHKLPTVVTFIPFTLVLPAHSRRSFVSGEMLSTCPQDLNLLGFELF